MSAASVRESLRRIRDRREGAASMWAGRLVQILDEMKLEPDCPTRLRALHAAATSFARCRAGGMPRLPFRTDPKELAKALGLKSSSAVVGRDTA